MIERHFCLSRQSFVHHIECSLEPDEFAELVRLSGDDMDGEREKRCLALPSEAYTSTFGMSGREREFLVEQTYGQKYIGDASTI